MDCADGRIAVGIRRGVDEPAASTMCANQDCFPVRPPHTCRTIRPRMNTIRFAIIGCGGITAPEHAVQLHQAGAELIELYSGMIFTGPRLPADCAAALGKVSS